MADTRRTSEARQIELTDAALHIIATKGIAALNTRVLAEQVGLTTGAIFRHFVSLEALLDAVVARVESVLMSTYPSADLGPKERLLRFIENRSATVANQLGILRLVLSDQFQLALPQDGASRLSVCVDKTRAFITECLRDGQAIGEFRTELPPESLAPIVMGTIQMLALAPSKTRKRDADSRAVVKALLTLLENPSRQGRPK